MFTFSARQGSRSFVFYIFLFLSLNTMAQMDKVKDGFNKFYDENGKISSEGLINEGKPDGYWKTYFNNGKIKSEGNRKNFELDSLWKFYNNEGIIVLEFNYKGGKKNGFKKSFDTKEGYLISEENYLDDIKQGPTNYYYKGKKIHQKINFDKGKEEGFAFEFALDSNIITVTEYKLGFIKKQEKINRRDKNNLKQGMWKNFYESGILKNECNYSDDKKNGFYKEYSLSGSLLNTEKYVKGELQKDVPELTKLDMKTEYYQGGNIKYYGGFKNGVAEGVHRDYAITGEVTNAKIYKDGVLTAEGILDDFGHEQGQWKEYHPNGQIKSKGEYKDGKRINDWVFFYSNGKIEQKGNYDKKGRAQGIWIWYYDDGKILREENYVDDLQEGIMVEYGDTGNVITKGNYIEGLKEGPWIYEIGDYKETGEYKLNKRQDLWKHFYNNGALRFEGNFIDGNPDGKHKYFYPDGKVKEEGRYTMGVKQDDWVYFNEDGSLFLTITFKNDVEIKFDGVKVKSAVEVNSNK